MYSSSWNDEEYPSEDTPKSFQLSHKQKGAKAKRHTSSISGNYSSVRIQWKFSICEAYAVKTLHNALINYQNWSHKLPNHQSIEMKLQTLLSSAALLLTAAVPALAEVSYSLCIAIISFYSATITHHIIYVPSYRNQPVLLHNQSRPSRMS